LIFNGSDRDEADKSKRATVDKSKQRRKKSDKLPKLKIVSIERDGEVVEIVECLLESGKLSSVVFKFSPDIDNTDDIADSLVCLCLSKLTLKKARVVNWLHFAILV